MGWGLGWEIKSECSLAEGQPTETLREKSDRIDLFRKIILAAVRRKKPGKEAGEEGAER